MRRDFTPEQYQRTILEQQAEIDRLRWLVATLRDEIRELTQPTSEPVRWPIPADLERMQPWAEM